MHHAYLVFGGKEALHTHLSREGVLFRGNPDFLDLEFDAFGIDESRSLKERASRKAATEDAKKIFIISANSFTIEAQNALLKLFEDPVPDTHFFIISTFASYFLPTLKSRLAELNLLEEKQAEKQKKINILAQEFLGKKPADRILFAAKIAKEEDDYGKQRAIEIIEGLIVYIRAKNIIPAKKDASTLEKLLTYRDYLSHRSPSAKMILETAAIML